MKLIWTETARVDLEQIYRYIARDSPEFADLVISSIVDQANNLLKFRKIGRVVPELGLEEFREIFSQNYRIIYHLTLEDIEIMTVLHSRRRLKV